MEKDLLILNSIINQFEKGYDLKRIIDSLPSFFCKKTERKNIVYQTIYNHLIAQKGKS